MCWISLDQLLQGCRQDGSSLSRDIGSALDRHICGVELDALNLILVLAQIIQSFQAGSSVSLGSQRCAQQEFTCLSFKQMAGQMWA